jgi:hypothetical protein
MLADEPDMRAQLHVEQQQPVRLHRALVLDRTPCLQDDGCLEGRSKLRLLADE